MFVFFPMELYLLRRVPVLKMKSFKFFLLILLILFPIISAETTFFEGDYFISGELVEEIEHSGHSACEPLWRCTKWENCTDEIQSRECESINSCNNLKNKPAENRFCNILTVPFVYIEEMIENQINEMQCNCPEPGEFNDCIPSGKTRINYECTNETNYGCIKYFEKVDCDYEEDGVSLLWLLFVLPILIAVTSFMIKRKNLKKK